jgi:hypothetical protein
MHVGEDADADLVEELRENDSKQLELVSNLVDTAGYLIKCFGPAGLGAFNASLRAVLEAMAHPAAPDDIFLQAICLYDDFVEFARGADPGLEDALHGMCLRGVESDDAPVARAAVWGLGILGQHAGERFRAHALSSAQVLMRAVDKWRLAASQTQDEDLQFMAGLVADNALSAVDKIARCRGHPELAQYVLQAVPLTADAEEARVVNVQLERYVEAGVLPASRFVALVAAQLHHGLDAGSGVWDEDDAFVCAEQRKSVGSKLQRGVLAVAPGTVSDDGLRLLQKVALEAAGSSSRQGA